MCKKPGEEGARDIYTGEGWFKMLSLSRSFTVADNSGMKSRTGGLSVSLAGPDGWVIGGGVVGLLTVVGWPHPYCYSGHGKKSQKTRCFQILKQSRCYTCCETKKKVGLWNVGKTAHHRNAC
ncbi:hypothetical protein AAZX31_14G135900 [Glycine max]|nr:hypothetical protein GLYMA_14G151350v4 [Glycine max]KAH1094584.1 hypothetical protein GYH30_040044 [Glycine max]